MSYLVDEEGNAINKNNGLHVQVTGSNVPEATPIPNKSTTTYFDYQLLPYRVCAVNGTTLFASTVNPPYRLYKSTDCGDSWVALASLPANTVNGFLTDSGKLILFTSNNKLIYSGDDGVTVQEIMASVYAPLQHGIDGNGDTVIFGEYTTASPVTLNVYKSTDGGATWNAVLTKNAPGDIRHFHTVKYFREHNIWYLTSGDSDAQTKWWTGGTDGATWTEVAGNVAVPWRTVGLASTAPRTIVWASDQSQDTFIYAARKGAEQYTYRKIGVLPGPCLGIAGNKDLLVCSARIEITDPKGSIFNPIYISPDCGRTWYRESGMTAKVTGSGFEGIRGPDKNGNFYFSYYNIEESADIFCTVKATPRSNITLPSSPVSHQTNVQPFLSEIINEDIRDATARIIYMSQTLYFSDLYDPHIVVYNSLDVAVTLKQSVYLMQTSKPADGALVSISIAAGKSMVISGTDLFTGRILSKNGLINFTPASAPTSGTLKAELHGFQYVPEDVRLL